MKFTEQLWEAILPVYEKILEHPFITGLIRGDLEQERFFFYVEQDSLYLLDYSKVLAIIASRCEGSGRVLQFLDFARYSILYEQENHKRYLADQNRVSGQERSPACQSYADYLLKTACLGSLEEAIAAILPCFIVYERAGRYIHERASKDNPYRYWIDAYVDPEFEEATDKALVITDELASGASASAREKMKKAFVLATKMEYRFWDGAWKKEGWPV